MSRKRPGHRDVRGRCDLCFEEWPCRSAREGRPYLPSGVQAWEHDELLAEMLAKSNEQLEVNRRVNRLAAMLGFELDVPDFCTGIMVEPQLLLAMLERCSGEEMVT